MIQKVFDQKKKTRLIDIFILVGFTIISLAFTFGRIGLHFNNFLLSSSDSANISSFAAALDHPQFFANDPFLKNQTNFAFYNTIHIPLIRWLGQIFGNYSSPFAFLVFPLTFLHLLGYYLLGKAIINNRFWALIFSLTVLIPVQLNLGEIWGLLRDAIPRFLFQSLLPFLLTALILWGKNPKSWPWLMAATGFLVYAHPVSLPAWGFAVILSLWVLAPEMPIKQKALRLLFAVFLFLVVITPFTINYLSTTTFGSRGSINYEDILIIMRRRFIPGFLDLNLGIKDFIKIVIISDWFIASIWVFVFFGGIGIFIAKRKTENKTHLVLATWWAAVFFVGILIPVVDHGLANYLKRMPLEVDLIRNLRYSIPLLLLSTFYLLFEVQLIIAKKGLLKSRPMNTAIFFLLGLLLLVGWALRNDFLHDSAFSQSARCWASGQLACPFQNEDKVKQQIELLEAIKTITPTGSRFMAFTDTSELMIRYYALRPLIYSYKDGAALIYTNHADLLVWWKQFQEINQIESRNSRVLYLDGLVEFSRKYLADYLVLPETYSPQKYYPAGLDTVFTNLGYSLLHIAY
jgi:hypothetical protein